MKRIATDGSDSVLVIRGTHVAAEACGPGTCAGDLMSRDSEAIDESADELTTTLEPLALADRKG